MNTIKIRNPYTQEFIGAVPNHSTEELDQMIENAVKAQKHWKSVPIYKRTELVQNFLKSVQDNYEDLARTLSLESGKTITEARMEICNISTSWTAFSEKIKHLYDSIIPAGTEFNHDKNIVFTKREPLGIVACIIPFNFPCNLFNQKVAPALLAGNGVIVKPASHNPLTICKLVKLLHEAGFPKEIVQVVTGSGSSIGSYLCEHKKIAAVSLTGSTSVGIEVAKKAAQTLKTIALELGGNDAFIVLEDADLELAVHEAVHTRFFNAGQICCAPKRFLIHKSLYADFLRRVVEEVSQFQFGNLLDENTKMGTVISEDAAITIENQINHTLQQGGKLLLGGERKGAFVAPTIISDIPWEADILHDMEVFGPVMAVTSFEQEDDALQLANDSIYGLGASIFTRDMKKAMYFTNTLEAGSVVINGSSYFRSFEMPFGGYKYSGLGSEGVFSTFEEFTQTKCITLKGIL